MRNDERRNARENATLQPDTEMISGAAVGLYDKVIRRSYQPAGTPGLPPGCYTGFTVGPDVTNPAGDYTAGYSMGRQDVLSVAVG